MAFPSRRFVGRVEELSALRAALERAIAGEPRVVLVSGPQGIGKSALVQQIIEESEKRIRTVKVDSSQSENPFGAVESLLTNIGPRSDVNSARDDGQPLFTLSAGAKVVSFLGTAQEEHPLMMWVDDAQRIDLDSLQAIGFALLRQRAERLLTVICTREAEQTVRDMGLVFLEPPVVHVGLDGLEPSEVRLLIESHLGTEPTELDVQRLYERSRGVPLFLQAVVNSRGESFPEGSAPEILPESLEQAVRQWAGSFDATSVKILETLSALNSSTPVSLLSELLESDSIVADAEPLIEQKVAFWEERDGVRALGLHAWQRDAFYSAISSQDRRQLHEKIAEVLPSAEGLQHRVAASDHHDAMLAHELREAAEREEESCRVPLAATYYVDSMKVEPDLDLRQRSLVNAIRLLVTSGYPRKALDHYQSVLQLPVGAYRDDALGLLSLAEGKDGRAQVFLSRARDAYESAGDMRWAADAACALSVAEGALGLGVQSLESSKFALRYSGKPFVRGMALANYAYGQGLVGGPATGLVYLDDLPEEASATPVTHTDALYYRGAFRTLVGDLAGGVNDLSVAAQRRSAGAARIGSVSALVHSVWGHFFLGDWQRAFRTVSVARDVAQVMGRPVDFFTVHCISGVLHAFSGRVNEGRTELVGARGIGTSADFTGPEMWLAANEAMVEFSLGNYAGVADLFGESRLAHMVDDVRLRLYAIRYLPFVGVARARTGDRAGAVRVLRILESIRARGALLSVVVLWLKGAIFAADGDSQAAVRSYQASLEETGWGGDPLLHKALVEYDLGALLLDGGDETQAFDHLRAAENAFAQMGADGLKGRTHALLAARSGSSDYRGGLLEIWDGMTTRERDIAGLVARGWTNREIADVEYLSVKTVEYHLGNIYSKAGIRSRRELRDILQSHTPILGDDR
ncbi:AAA family ATPase [Streptomyces sp. NPDC051014]|uniref:helix-turn-helix transcriptional regulator n=1 Tax=Streptomyces sp. NPDC051014 TaxID=3155751 RepID=UPI0033F52F55